MAANEDARRIGKPLKGRQSDLWRYRVGDYRLICQIQGQALKVLLVSWCTFKIGP
ncbi:MAG: type II toxin-antitoxin system RelE family toxin [Nitrospiraceae bacterium]